MKKDIFSIIGILGFFVIWGAAGGIEQGTASMMEGLIIAVVGIIMMFSGYVANKGEWQ